MQQHISRLDCAAAADRQRTAVLEGVCCQSCWRLEPPQTSRVSHGTVIESINGLVILNFRAAHRVRRLIVQQQRVAGGSRWSSAAATAAAARVLQRLPLLPCSLLLLLPRRPVRLLAWLLSCLLPLLLPMLLMRLRLLLLRL